MVKAELYYNPYKIETKVKFNGNEPRVNSMIEKYEDKRLQDWIEEIPLLFKEELSGYDFDLDFIGTDFEFDEVKAIFEKKVGDGEFVNITHVETLMDRASKIKQITEFLQWLSTANSNYFDYQDFYSTNEDLLTSSFPFMVLNGTEEDVKDINTENISIEYIDDFEKLTNINLRYNPILICVDENYAGIIHKAIGLIEVNHTVSNEQVFFLVREQSIADKVKRFIEDLGIINPKVVISSGDEMIIDYMDAYPLCQYIHDLLSLLRATSDDINHSINIEREKIEESHKNEYTKLSRLDFSLERIDNALDSFYENSFEYTQSVFDVDKQEFREKMGKWKERSAVILGDDVAEKEADHLINSILKWNAKFTKNIKEVLSAYTFFVSENFAKTYTETELEQYQIRKDTANFDLAWDGTSTIKALKEKLLVHRTAKWVEEKHIKFMAKAEVQNVLKGEYDLSKWRETMFREIEAVMNREIAGYLVIATDFYSDIKKHYEEVLQIAKQKNIDEKEKILSHLSDDVREVENEKIWADELADRIEMMERT